ncbi:MFS transporter [Streptomyces decoyicus]
MTVDGADAARTAGPAGTTAEPDGDRSADRKTAARPAGGWRGRPWLTVFTLSLAAMMVSLDGTIVAVAQPVMQQRLHASLTEMQWVTNGYLLAVAVLLIVAGRVGDLFGHRQVFLAGTLGFTLASAAIGLSTDVGAVICFRVLQGVFGALMQPATLALIMTAFPADRMNLPIAVRSSVIAVSMALGPIAGGLIVHYASWQLAFFINVPLGALTVLLGLVVLRDAKEEGAARGLDVPGLLLLSATLSALVWGLTAVSGRAWGDPAVWAPLAGAAALACCFVGWERRAANPVIPMPLFRSPLLSVGVLLLIVNAFSLFGTSFFLAFYLQHVRGLTPMESGLQVLPLTVMMVVGAPFVALWIGKAGPRIPAALGMLMNAVALFGISRLDGHEGGGQLGFWLFVMGLGFSPIMVGATKLVLGNAPQGFSGVASGIQQTAMQVGGSLGVAVLGALMASGVRDVLSRRLAADGTRLSAGQFERTVQSVSVGLHGHSAQTSGLPSSVFEQVSRAAFRSGMGTALTVTCLVALCAAVAGLLVRTRQPAK